MVAKKIAGVAGAGAGGFAGGILNNPGALAAIGIVITIVTSLLLFRNDIRNFFGTTIPEAIGSIGDIQLPSIVLPSFEFEFPDITFPSFPDISLTLFGDGEAPEIPDPFVGPERMGVPFDVPGREDLPPIDIVPDVTGGRGERLAGVIGEEPEEEFEADPSLFALTTFGDGAVRVEQEQALALPTDPIPFAVRNVEETQAEFQERSAAFAEMFPGTTFATSIDGDVPSEFIRQLSRESEDFEDVLAREAARSESIFAALFGNVQNPEFGA